MDAARARPRQPPVEDDVELRVRQQMDPLMMAELGGPRPREDIERAHAKSLALAAEGNCWPLKVFPEGATSPAGDVTVFESSYDGETIYEIGWMILPQFHPRMALVGWAITRYEPATVLPLLRGGSTV